MAYDNTNSGVIFPPKDEASGLVGVGHVHFGTEKKNVMIHEVVLASGKKVYKVFVEAGALFTVDEKKSDQHPDKTGPIKVNGVDYSMAAWDKKSKNNTDYTSVSVSVKSEYAAKQDGGQTGEGTPF